jgi:hypothetical protein
MKTVSITLVDKANLYSNKTTIIDNNGEYSYQAGFLSTDEAVQVARFETFLPEVDEFRWVMIIYTGG